jgi:hypothetical protein
VLVQSTQSQAKIDETGGERQRDAIVFVQVISQKSKSVASYVRRRRRTGSDE